MSDIFIVPTSETIWKDETEQALVDMIKCLIKYKDNTNVTHNISASVRDPKEVLKTEKFPCVTIYNLYDDEAIYRRQYDFSHRLVHRNYDTKQALVEKPPNPYDLYYQIDFWSLLNRQMNDLTLQWVDHCGGFFNLDCKDRSANVRNIFCKQIGNNKRLDYFSESKQGNTRVFHSIFTYRIWVEIYERKTYNVPMVTDVEFVTHNLSDLLKGEYSNANS